MPRFLLAALLPFVALVSAVACDTDAKGIDECRDIERARCAAARSCDFGIDSDEKLAACERFARDDCLHGVSTGVDPKRSQVDACLRVIRGAGDCAGENGAETPALECASIGDLRQRGVNVCDVVEDPTLANECAWLLEDPPEPPEPEPDGGSEE